RRGRRWAPSAVRRRGGAGAVSLPHWAGDPRRPTPRPSNRGGEGMARELDVRGDPARRTNGLRTGDFPTGSRTVLARRPGRGALVVLVLAALGQAPLARADSGNVVLNLDRYDGTEAIRGWAAGAMWMGRAGDQDPFRVGLAGVWLEDGHWGYAAAGRTFHLGQRNQCDASARWGRASLPGQSHDFTEVSATLYTSVVPGRWIVTLGDSWLDVGDREGQLVQGGLDFVARGRWSAGLRLFSGITGDLEENYLNGNVRLRGASVTWVLGATVGRTVPFPGAAPDAT